MEVRAFQLAREIGSRLIYVGKMRALLISLSAMALTACNGTSDGSGYFAYLLGQSGSHLFIVDSSDYNNVTLSADGHAVMCLTPPEVIVLPDGVESEGPNGPNLEPGDSSISAKTLCEMGSQEAGSAVFSILQQGSKERSQPE
ncbi:hypothetical protein KC660_02195 [Candidatus Dojkabacteria bacterium]|uniref:Uncharacterized protein n=1 Tax=Candidatus Dojkabacteria bacterium TaxID=2099670 RepID=A0A955RHX3_9BACT|nr:hypothetical protein [Candidatus Dojkabacteria bacterium]